MRTDRPGGSCGGHGGLVLPVVLVLLAGLWLLAISLLSLAVVSRRSSHLRADELQAELAARAGLAHLSATLLEGCSKEDFLVIGGAVNSLREAPRLHLVEPAIDDGGLRYVHRPLFSDAAGPHAGRSLRAPEAGIGPGGSARLRAHPWFDPVMVDWLPVHNREGQAVARYAYWVEDLEGKIDPRLLDGTDTDCVRLEAMDPSPHKSQAKALHEHRQWLMSPGSVLAAAGIRPPLERWSHRQDPQLAGRLSDPWAAFLESHNWVGLCSYAEQPRVPYVEGISPAMMGRTKRNLNDLLRRGDGAEQEMAWWIRACLPEFENRRGGFPEDYLETLAANALDYADEDGRPRLVAGRHRGIDGQPFLSEVVLHLHFHGLVWEEDRWALKWTLRLFAELWNLSSVPVEGGARLTYEVNLQPTPVGTGDSGLPFDAPELLDDPRQSSHPLQQVQGHYVTPEIAISLRPDEYRFHQFAEVHYRIDCSPQLDGSGHPMAEWFDLVELEHQARGLSLIWNGVEVERLQRVHRDPHGLANFRTDRGRKTAKACIPALNYGGYDSMINNPGDPRMSHYFRALPLGENAYPENLSPHRRNIRRRNIYDRDPSPFKTRHYGRVMPSEWPDGGHNSATGNFRVTTSDARFPTDGGLWPLAEVPTPQASHAPQRISNRGWFASVTELGRVHDPVMWTPAYADLAGVYGSGSHDTAELLGGLTIWQRPSMPMRRGCWPEVSADSVVSAVHGGGNSLRIGRPEHARFDRPGLRASHLLDLFYCDPVDDEDALSRQMSTIAVEGRVNLNTASRDVLRCLAYKKLGEDEAISRVISRVHDTAHAFGPQLEAWRATEEQLQRVADRVADGIIRSRPLASPSQLAHIRESDGSALFGNPRLHEESGELQWSDAAAEELFAGIHDATGVRSRHFRVWVVGQTIRGEGKDVEVTAEVRRVVSLFVDPGQRSASGELIAENQRVRILHERAF